MTISLKVILFYLVILLVKWFGFYIVLSNEPKKYYIYIYINFAHFPQNCVVQNITVLHSYLFLFLYYIPTILVITKISFE